MYLIVNNMEIFSLLQWMMKGKLVVFIISMEGSDLFIKVDQELAHLIKKYLDFQYPKIKQQKYKQTWKDINLIERSILKRNTK